MAISIVMLDYLITLYQLSLLFTSVKGDPKKFTKQSQIAQIASLKKNRNISLEHWLKVSKKISVLKLNS